MVINESFCLQLLSGQQLNNKSDDNFGDDFDTFDNNSPSADAAFDADKNVFSAVPEEKSKTVETTTATTTSTSTVAATTTTTETISTDQDTEKSTDDEFSNEIV